MISGLFGRTDNTKSPQNFSWEAMAQKNTGGSKQAALMILTDCLLKCCLLCLPCPLCQQGLCTCACMFMLTCQCGCAQGGQRSLSYVILHFSLLYLLRQGFSLNLELVDLARLVDQGISCLRLPRLGTTSSCCPAHLLYLEGQRADSVPGVHTANTSLMVSPASVCFFFLF